jgi:L-aspartate oxidase
VSAGLEIVAADAVVVGTGAAGLAAALGLAPGRVHLLTKATLDAGAASLWAQGGVAAAVGEGDSPDLHAADTVAAGAGLVAEEMATLLARDGVAAIGRLVELGAALDREPGGGLSLGREAAHGRRRIVHARGDRTGAEIVRALAAGVAASPSIRLFERCFATRLLVEGGRVAGVESENATGETVRHRAPRVVLATGGCGQVYRCTTNPREATGDGLALAAEAGVALLDLEFVQFHPTALAATGLDPLPLLSEALRGEGAVLVDGRGHRFMPEEHEAAELAPRDVVARAIWRRLAAGETVFLDARRALGDRFPARFPAIFEICRAAGIDPRVAAIPVTPAAHYHMGGIAVDAWGRSSRPGLWACGEVASTGVHGANRLASNSLLEALVFGARVAASAKASLVPAPSTAASGPARRRAPDASLETVRAEARGIAWERIGLVRDGAGLAAASTRLAELHATLPPGAGETRSVVTVAWLIAAAAAHRRESRGAHYRTDAPVADPAWRARLLVRPGASDGGLSASFERSPVAEFEPPAAALAEAVAR